MLILSPRLALRSHTHSLLVYKGLGLSTCGHPFPKPMLNKQNTRGSPQKILRPAFAGATLKFQTLESSRGKKGKQAGKEAWRPHRVLSPKPTSIEQDRPPSGPPAAFKGMALVLKRLVGLHRTAQLQLLQWYWVGHRLGLL